MFRIGAFTDGYPRTSAAVIASQAGLGSLLGDAAAISWATSRLQSSTLRTRVGHTTCRSLTGGCHAVCLWCSARDLGNPPMHTHRGGRHQGDRVHPAMVSRSSSKWQWLRGGDRRMMVATGVPRPNARSSSPAAGSRCSSRRRSCHVDEWKRGRASLFRRTHRAGLRLSLSEGSRPPAGPRAVHAIFLTATSDTVPHALLHT